MRLATLAIIAVSTLAAGSLLAEPPIALVRKACEASANTLCKDEVASGKRGRIHVCLVKNLEKTTPDCQKAIKTAQEHAAARRAAGETGEKGDAASH